VGSATQPAVCSLSARRPAPTFRFKNLETTRGHYHSSLSFRERGHFPDFHTLMRIPVDRAPFPGD